MSWARPAAVWLSAALIAAAALLVYANSFRGVFVLDEQASIVNNRTIRTLSPGAHLTDVAPEAGVAGRPVASLSFALNYQLAPPAGREAFMPPPPGYPPEAWALFYRNLWGYHAFNLTVHILAGLALFGVVRRTLLAPRLAPRYAYAATPLALVISLLWVTHPLGTNSVTYVVQRIESLMGLFYLLTLYCAIRASASKRAGWWSAAAVLACLLGAATKEIIVTAPLIVVLWDALFLARRSEDRGSGRHAADDHRNSAPVDVPVQAGGAGPVRAILSRRWPLYLGLASAWALLAALVAAYPRGASVGFHHETWTPWTYLVTQAGVIVHYLRLAFVPWPLVLDYEWRPATSFVEVLPQALLLGALFALTAWGLARRHPLSFLGAWFFLVLGPTSSVLPIVTEVAAEHRMYLPLAAVVAFVVLAAHHAATHWLERTGAAESSAARQSVRCAARGRQWAAAGFAVAAVAVVALGYLSVQRNDDYTSEERIWSETVRAQPHNSRARSNHATVLFETGRFHEAEAQFRAAISLRPDYPEAQANLGAALCAQGKLAEGVEHLRRALELEPHYRDANRNLGNALTDLGRPSEALAAYRRALDESPDDVGLLNRVAWLLATAPDEGVRHGGSAVAMAERSVALTSRTDADSLDTLAAAYAEAGRYADAVRTEAEALAVARTRGPAGLVPQLEGRLQLFQAGRAYRQPRVGASGGQ